MGEAKTEGNGRHIKGRRCPEQFPTSAFEPDVLESSEGGFTQEQPELTLKRSWRDATKGGQNFDTQGSFRACSHRLERTSYGAR